MLQAATVHNDTLDLLLRYRRFDPDFTFTLRKSNRAQRLEKGYWFYGNDGYLAVSFWSGMDWKNKIPNINFIIVYETGETYLEISTTDSESKRKFVVDYLIRPLNLAAHGQRFRKVYKGNYLESLKEFIEKDKNIIDSIVRKYSDNFGGTHENKIGFINTHDFENQLAKIKSYQNRVYLFTDSSDDREPIKLKSFLVQNFGPIHELCIDDIDFNTQWIFLRVRMERAKHPYCEH